MTSQDYAKDFGNKSFFEEFPGWRTEPVMENLLTYGEMLAGEAFHFITAGGRVPNKVFSRSESRGC